MVKNRLLFTLLFSSLFAGVTSSEAAPYRYQDEAGNIFWADSVSEVPEQYREQVLPPKVLPYKTEQERQRWIREQKKMELKRKREIEKELKLQKKKNGKKGKGGEKEVPTSKKSSSGSSSLGPEITNNEIDTIVTDATNAAAPEPEDDGKVHGKQLEKVELYVSPGCEDCEKLAATLKRKGVNFLKLDVVKNTKAFARFDSLRAGTKLPVTKVGKQIIHGYEPEAIADASRRIKSKQVDEGTL